jgi:hypothetical protein
MAYTKSSDKNLRTVDHFGLNTKSSNSATQLEFYELELGVVLDVILDDTHPFFKKGSSVFNTVDADRWPLAVNNKPASSTDIDYSWIGRILARPIESGTNITKDKLIWAYPAESNISEYPLIYETVVLSQYDGKTYYSKKVNYHNWANNNLDFNIDLVNPPNTELFSTTPYTGTNPSTTNYKGNTGYSGYAGKYFVSNNRIRNLRRYEGDLAIESRFGQSIHFTAYDNNRNNDISSPSNTDYVNNGGNPMILIRNRQRPILEEGKTLSLHNSPNPAKITGTPQEKNVGGYISEDINHDGSSIHITSGKTNSNFVTTCYKTMYGVGKGEEVPAFQGTTNFKYPSPLDGDQIVINSDRLIFSSRYGESLHFSKKRYGIVTDSEFIVDAHDQIVLNTHVKTVINSPAIYLGEGDQTGEPALLGQTTINWLYEMCNWMLAHTHWYLHNHPDAQGGRTGDTKDATPQQTQLAVQQARLISLQSALQTLASRRVFITGGGYAPGQDGVSI